MKIVTAGPDRSDRPIRRWAVISAGWARPPWRRSAQASLRIGDPPREADEGVAPFRTAGHLVYRAIEDVPPT